MKNIRKSLLLLLFWLSAHPLWAQPTTPITVALDWYINPDQAPLLVAITRGYFAKAGLSLTLLTPTTNEEEPIQLVASGRATLGVSNQLELLEAVTQGAPLVRIASLAAHTMTCIATIDPKINHLSDLAHHRIGYSGGPLNPALVRYMLQYAGVSPQAVTLVNVNMDLIQALLSHRVTAAAGMVRSVEVVQLKAMGYTPHIFQPEDYGIPPYEEMVFVANRQINPSVVKAFVHALTQGAVYLSQHPEASWQQVSHQYPTALTPTPEMARINHAIWIASVPYFGTHPAHFNATDYAHFGAFLVTLGLIPKNPPISQYTWADTSS